MAKPVKKMSLPAWQEALLDSLPAAVMVIERKGTIRWMNAAAEHLFEASLAQVQGKKLSQLLPDASLGGLLARVFAQGHSVRETSHALQRAGNKSEIVHLHVVPFWQEEAVILTCEKPSAAELMAGQELQRESVRRAGVMAAMLAHEVKNPLGGIRGAAQLLQQDGAAQPMTELICREVDRISGLLNQFELFSDTRALPLEAVNIHEVLQDVMTLAQESFAAHVQFEEEYDPSLPPVSGHRDALVQVLLNLVKNAAEAVQKQKNARITLRTSYRSALYAAGGKKLPIVVTVEDNGPGIPAQIRDTLFEPFVSTKEDGRGLGLAIVSKLVADLRGAVEVESGPGRTAVHLALAVG